MPRRLRIKFRGNFSLPLDKGTFTVTGQNVGLDPRFEIAESSRIQLGSTETRWHWASKGHRGLEYEWLPDGSNTAAPGGMWLNSLGALNSASSPFVTTPTIPAGSVSVNIDVSSVGGDLYLKGIEPGARWGAWTVTLDGVTAEAWWIDPSTTLTLPMGGGSSTTASPFYVKNQNNGTLLVLTWTTPTNAARTITVNHAIGPLIPEYPFGPNTGSAPNIYDFEPTDMAALLAWGTAGNSTGVEDFGNTGPLGDAGTFGVDPDNGIKYARHRIPVGERSGISWWKEMPAGLTEAWFQYSAYIEESVWGGIHPDDACKFGAGPSEEVPWIQNESHDWSWRGHHGGKSQNNPHVFSLEEYREHSASLVTVSEVKNTAVRAGRWYVYDTYIKLNTINGGGTGNSDGIGRMWINKNLIHEFTTCRWRNSAVAVQDGHLRDILAHWVNFYQGGTGEITLPVSDMWYRIGRIRASTTEIAIPPEFVTSSLTFPTWRQGLTVGQIATISGTGGTGVIPKNAHGLHWNGFAVCDDGRVVVTASGGHNSTAEDETNGQNKSCLIDLSLDAPTWSVVHAGTGTAEAPDWNGGDLGGFYATKPYRAHYPASAGDVPIRPPCQTYYNLQYARGAHCNDGNERVLNIGLRSPRSSIGGPNSRRQVDGFKLGTFQWDLAEDDATVYPFVGNGTKWADIPPRNGQSSSSSSESNEPSTCRDYRNGKIYWGADSSIFIFNPAVSTNQWTTGITANGVTGIYNVTGSGWSTITGRGMLVDTVRDRLVIMAQIGTTGARLEWFPLTGGTVQFITITGITAGLRVPNSFINKEPGFTHDLDNDRYLLLLSSSGATATDYWYSIAIPAAGVTTTTATLLHTSAAGSGGPGRALSSFQFCDALGGVVYAQSGLTTSTAHTRPILFLPTRSSP
jgi:hypothetical protein